MVKSIYIYISLLLIHPPRFPLPADWPQSLTHFSSPLLFFSLCCTHSPCPGPLMQPGSHLTHLYLEILVAGVRIFNFSFKLLSQCSALVLDISVLFPQNSISHHRITGCLRLIGTSVSIWTNRCSSRYTQSRVQKTMSRWCLNIYKFLAGSAISSLSLFPVLFCTFPDPFSSFLSSFTMHQFLYHPLFPFLLYSPFPYLTSLKQCCQEIQMS